VSVQALRLQEELMLRLVRKLDDLVFDGGAIARAYALNLPGIHCRPVDVFANDAKRFRRSKGDVAADLRLHNLPGAKAKRSGIRVARLLLKSCPADGTAIKARGRPGFEPAGAKPQRA